MITDDSIIEFSDRPAAPRGRRYAALYVLLSLVVITLAARGFFLQVVKGGTFRSSAEGNRVTAIPVPAPRGIVYDMNHNQLVENVASTDLVLDPASLPPEEYESALYEKLPQLLPVTPDEIRGAVTAARSSQRVTLLASALEHEQVIAVEQALSELPGVQLVSALVRNYPYGHALAHVMGYTSPVTADELKERPQLRTTDITGKIGLENKYNDKLSGQHGYSLVEIDASGKARKQLEQQAPVPGYDLELTLDADMQKFIFDLFAEKDHKSQEEKGKPVSGAVVALDPRSGAVRSLVSYPSFDPNFFSRPEWGGKAKDIFQNESRPLFNRAADGSYPPGSTIKPLIAAAALQEKIISPATTVSSTGGIAVGPWFFPDWKAGGHGITNVYKAIAQSVNTFFYVAVGGYEDTPGLGIERLVKYLKAFHWGQKTGIDLPSETAGFLPSMEWKMAAKNEPWYIGDTYHAAIGQGDILASPLQIATATATVANKGMVYQPTLARRLVKGDDVIEVSSEPVSAGINQEYFEVVRNGMRQTVTDGSAASLQDLPVEMAGKTGTAQIGGSEDTHAWFASFAPFDQPELTVVVLLERGGDGDKEAVPFAREIWQWWLENRSN